MAGSPKNSAAPTRINDIEASARYITVGKGDELTRWIRASDDPPATLLAGRGRLASDFLGTGAFTAAFSDERVDFVFFVFFFAVVFPPEELKLLDGDE